MIPLIIGLAAAGGAIGAVTGRILGDEVDKNELGKYRKGIDDGRSLEKDGIGAIRSGNAEENRLDDIV